MKLQKFENVDVIASLEAIMKPPVRDVLLPGTGRFSKGYKAA